MVLFSLYIEPLIRSIHDSISGILIYGKIIKLTAYADDITIFVRTQEEFDLVMQIVDSFSIYAKIKVNLQKSSFLRLNNISSGPQIFKEVDNMNVLGVVIADNWSKMIDANYEKLITAIQYRVTLNESRNLNLLEKVWILNTFILSKLWYLAQILPPKNRHLAKIKSICGNFIWRGHILRVARDQLYLDYTKGGLRLIDPEAKCKALFIRNLLLEEENYLLEYVQKAQLTRNGREWIEIGSELINNSICESTNMLYNFFINRRNICIKAEMDYPDVNWVLLWTNWSSNWLCSDDKSNLFMLFNDVIPNKEKLTKYGIGRIPDFNCDTCRTPDNNFHRIVECRKTVEIREWVSDIIRNKLHLEFVNLDEILAWFVPEKNSRLKAAMWLAVHSISYMVRQKHSLSLYWFKKSIRDIRWNNRAFFKKQFGNYLNVC